MDNIAQNSIISNQSASDARTTYRVKNERMGGFVTSWDAPKQVEQPSFNDVLSSYSPQPENLEKPEIITDIAKDKQGFGFMDLLDMVNPLQHIPLVNLAYRHITGDEIKPIGKIMGGAIFGGASGAASGLVSVVIQSATGKDAIGNASAFAGLSQDQAQDRQAYDDLPASLLAFAQTPLSSVVDNKIDYERVEIASGRTAGTIAFYA